MPKLETVKIKNADTERGWCIINKADFDPGKHELFKAKPGRPKKAKAD